MNKKQVKSIISIGASLMLLFALIGGTWASANAANASASFKYITPTISIVSVDPDKSVTIRTANYPVNDTFNVYMNYFGTRGIDGTKVTSIDSGSGGSFEKTFEIPDNLKGLAQIAIRLESPYSGYYSYDWFNNVTGGTVPNTGGPYTYNYTGLTPTFSITSVTTDDTVTILTANFPANDTFNVYMGEFGTRGIGGTKVGSVDSGSGGTLTYTFDIPDAYKGDYTIAIRLESPTSGYYSYNWFNNAY